MEDLKCLDKKHSKVFGVFFDTLAEKAHMSTAPPMRRCKSGHVTFQQDIS